MAADRRRRNWGAALAARALLIAVLVACDAPSVDGPAFGYDPALEYFDGGGRHDFFYHWPLGTSVRVFADPALQPAGWDLADAVRRGSALWQSEMYYREASLRLVASPADADVVVHFDGAPPVTAYPADCAPPFIQAAGVTVLCPNASYSALEVMPLVGGGAPGHVKMDVTIVASRIADLAQFRRVVAHEVGHVFGIGAHSGDATDLMFAAPQVDAPSAADGQTLRYVLHRPDAVLP